MTTLTKEGIKENYDALVHFTALNHDKWREFCHEGRNGKLDIEELSMLVTSLTAPNPWRIVIGTERWDEICRTFAEIMGEIMDKMEENESLVDVGR